MRFEIVNPFIDSLIDVCQKIGIDIVKNKVNLKTGKKIEKKISFYFKIKGDFKGIVIYEIDENLSTQIIKKIYNVDALPDDEEMLLSGIGEFGNIVNAKLIEATFRKGLNYSISHPIFSRSKGRVISYSSPCVEVSFSGAYGDIILSVVFESVYL
ncbi:MAG: chemotaxis protein CheX [Brevinematia bacterium]